MKAKKPLISIIVPIYNAEKYLRECIHSICNQTYRELEIILINDGSTDRSQDICEEFQKKDERILVINQKNGGEASARNTGLTAMSGEYLVFVDADDYVADYFVETLFHALIENDSEIAVCSYVEEDKKGKILKEYIFDDVMWKDGSGLFRFLKLEITGGVWNKLFQCKIIKDKGLRFAKDIKHGPDQLFIGEYLSYTKRGIILSDALYHYRYIENSISKQAFSERKFDVSRYSWITSAERLYDRVKSDSALIKVYEGYVAYRIQDTLFLMSLLHYRDKEMEKKMQKTLKSYRKSWISFGALSGKTKMMMRLACFSLFFYRHILFLFRRKFL